MSSQIDSPRLYVGHLSADVRTEDVESLFQPFGRIVDVCLMGAFGFVELETPRDAAAALTALNGKELKGDRIVLQPAKPKSKPERSSRDHPLSSGPSSRGNRDPWPPRHERELARAPLRRTPYRVLLAHLPLGLTWQDIKDLGRPHGTVVFADVDPARDDEGILEYNFRDEMEAAVRELDGFELRGNRLRADPVEAPPPPALGRGDRWRGGGRGFDRGIDRGLPRYGDQRDRRDRRDRYGDRLRDNRYRSHSPRRDGRDRWGGRDHRHNGSRSLRDDDWNYRSRARDQRERDLDDEPRDRSPLRYAREDRSPDERRYGEDRAERGITRVSPKVDEGDEAGMDED